MKIHDFKLIDKKLECLKPIPVKETLLYEREVCILELFTDKGVVIGELAPLPGLNQETLSQAKLQVSEVLGNLKEQDLPEFNLSSDFFAITQKEAYPSVRFAIEGALLNFVAPEKLQTVSINELLRAKVLSDYKNLTGSYKIKITQDGWEAQSDALLEFLDNNPAAFVRLDGNRTFDKDVLENFCKKIPIERIEYFEEPLKKIELWESLPKIIRPNFALDENLLTHKEMAPKETVAWIIKPQILGISKSINLVKEALHKNITPVISSCFEGAYGMRSLVQLINLPELKDLLRIPHGLGTYRFLKESSEHIKIIFDKNDIIIQNK